MICNLIYKIDHEVVTALAGHPDAGITTLAVEMAKYLVFQEQQGVIFFSPQFEKEDLILGYMPDTPDALLIDDTPGITVEEIREKCLAYMQQEKIRWIFIDHMLLMRSSNDFNSRIDELVEIVYGLNVLAKELHLRIIVLIPLTHSSTNKPGLHDFKEIGFELEKMVNFVLFLQQEKQEQEITLIKPDAACLKIKIYKNNSAEVEKTTL